MYMLASIALPFLPQQYVAPFVNPTVDPIDLTSEYNAVTATDAPPDTGDVFEVIGGAHPALELSPSTLPQDTWETSNPQVAAMATRPTNRFGGSANLLLLTLIGAVMIPPRVIFNSATQRAKPKQDDEVSLRKSVGMLLNPGLIVELFKSGKIPENEAIMLLDLYHSAHNDGRVPYAIINGYSDLSLNAAEQLWHRVSGDSSVVMQYVSASFVNAGHMDLAQQAITKYFAVKKTEEIKDDCNDDYFTIDLARSIDSACATSFLDTIQSAHWNARQNLAKAYAAVGKPDKAENLYKYCPNDLLPETRLAIAKSHLSIGQSDEAQRHVRFLLASYIETLKRGYGSAYFSYSPFLSDTVALARELQIDCDPLMEIFSYSDDPRYHILAAQAHVRLKEFDKAYPLLNGLMASRDTVILGRVAALCGKLPPEMGSAILLRLVQLPLDADVKKNVVMACAKIQGARALQILNQMADSTNDSELVSVAQACATLRDATSLEILQKLRKSASSTLVLKVAVYEAYVARGNTAEARNLLQIIERELPQVPPPLLARIGGDHAYSQLLRDISEADAEFLKSTAPYLDSKRWVHTLSPEVLRGIIDQNREYLLAQINSGS